LGRSGLQSHNRITKNGGALTDIVVRSYAGESWY
jgi:hypothetical protein